MCQIVKNKSGLRNGAELLLPGALRKELFNQSAFEQRLKGGEGERHVPADLDGRVDLEHTSMWWDTLKSLYSCM